MYIVVHFVFFSVHILYWWNLMLYISYWCKNQPVFIKLLHG